MDALASADGVFVLASATEFRDIAEAVKGAQAVISEVESLLRHLPEPQTGDQEESLPPAVDPAVFADRPSLLVVGVTRSRDLEDVPWETIKTRAESALCLRMEMMETLDDETLLQLRSLITENSINRVAIASENPSISLPSRKKLSELLGLPINFISIADLSPYFTTPDSPERLEAFILSRIETAVRFLKQARLYAQTDRTIVKKALIIGGGPAGLAAAKAVSDSGFESVILEKEDAVGGNIAEITGVGNQERLKSLVSGVKNDKQIQCLTGYTLKEHTGHAGVFKAVAVSGTGDPKIINHGALIIATGGKLNKPVSYLAGQNEKISGIADFRKQLEAGETDPASISTMGIILCTDSRENPFNYCSRICCMKSLETAILLKEKNPAAQVFIFYRDIMTYGKSEALYTEARQKGILFVQYDTNEKPRVSMDAGGLTLKARDRFSGFDLELALDILCLAPGVVPASIKSLASLLNLGLTDEGFIREADPKWRPVDTGREGIFIAGLARAPGRINEILEDGQAAAARAVRILQRNRLSPSAVVARVKDRTCSRCGICIETCPYGARYHSMVDDRVVVDPAACQGCGSCAVACPNSATVISGFEDQAILDALESVF